jgi:hypothetical protein
MRTESAFSHGADMNTTDTLVIKNIVWHAHEASKAARPAQKYTFLASVAIVTNLCSIMIASCSLDLSLSAKGKSL